MRFVGGFCFGVYVTFVVTQICYAPRGNLHVDRITNKGFVSFKVMQNIRAMEDYVILETPDSLAAKSLAEELNRIASMEKAP